MLQIGQCFYKLWYVKDIEELQQIEISPMIETWCNDFRGNSCNVVTQWRGHDGRNEGTASGPSVCRMRNQLRSKRRGLDHGVLAENAGQQRVLSSSMGVSARNSHGGAVRLVGKYLWSIGPYPSHFGE